MLFELLEKLTLDFQIFHDGFDNEVAVFQFRKIVDEVAGGYERGEFRNKEGRG